MGRFLLHRAIESLVALWLASIIVFAGMRALPGDPAIALSGEGRRPGDQRDHPGPLRPR